MTQHFERDTKTTNSKRTVVVKRATANRPGRQRLARALIALAQAQLEAEAEQSHKQTKVARKGPQ